MDKRYEIDVLAQILFCHLISKVAIFTLQPTASRMLSNTITDRNAIITLGWSSLTAGQKVKTSTEPERQSATTMVHQLSQLKGRIHRTLI